MGDHSLLESRRTMIKIAFVVCCAILAAAEAVANPPGFYNSYPHQGFFPTGYGYSSGPGYNNGYQGFQPGFGPHMSYSSGRPGYHPGYDHPGYYGNPGYHARYHPGANQPFGYKANGRYMTNFDGPDGFYNNAFPSGYHGYSSRPFHSGYSNFFQPSYYGGHYVIVISISYFLLQEMQPRHQV